MQREEYVRKYLSRYLRGRFADRLEPAVTVVIRKADEPGAPSLNRLLIETAVKTVRQSGD